MALSGRGCVLAVWLIAALGLGAAETTSHPVGGLRLEKGFIPAETGRFRLKFVRSSQTLAALEPRGMEGFDFTPGDWLEKRRGDGYYHLGDLNVRVRREGSRDWSRYSSSAARTPVKPIPVTPGGAILAAADLSPTFPTDMPLAVERYWEKNDGDLILRFRLRNRSVDAVEIGALGIPMIFNNILHERSLEEAHAACSFSDPYIGGDAGYIQAVRLDGTGRVLLVLPLAGTPLEAYNPLLDDPTLRSYTCEGFYEWLAHSLAYARGEWRGVEPWNVPTSARLEPGEVRDYGVVFTLADSLRNVEAALDVHGRPVAVGVPGYVLPMDADARLFVRSPAGIGAVTVHPTGALTFVRLGTTPGGWDIFRVRGAAWGRARLTVNHTDGTGQTVHYKVIKPEAELVRDLGRFLLTRQWYENPDDPFHRNDSVISYDAAAGEQVTQDDRVWIAGLGDEGGSGSWLSAVMKQFVSPDAEEIRRLRRFVRHTLWGKLQYDRGERKYGVRKSLFYYEPTRMPRGTYSPGIRYKPGFPSWGRREAESTGRSYNYPHVAAAYWVFYRLARFHVNPVTGDSWRWYLEQACRTALAMVDQAPEHARFGQMEGTVFRFILIDLEREGLEDLAGALRGKMRVRAEVWKTMGFPFGSEMPWDSTGQEEVYAWCRYFGFHDRAATTLNAILAYMPTMPHWGYNGSARRFWDFLFAGRLRRFERQLHHYGSGLNAIPVLDAYRSNPDDFYLLRVGYGGLMGAVSNVTREGFGPTAFHAFPSTLRADTLSGDYGCGFFGYAVNTATYVCRHGEFGWLAFGGNLRVDGARVIVRPTTAARSRIFLAPLGLWLTLDTGRFARIDVHTDTGEVNLQLVPGDHGAAAARLRIERPGRKEGTGAFAPLPPAPVERGAYVIPLGADQVTVTLRPE